MKSQPDYSSPNDVSITMSLSMLATRMKQRKSLAKSIGREAPDLDLLSSMYNRGGPLPPARSHDDDDYSDNMHNLENAVSELLGGWKMPVACACRGCALKQEEQERNRADGIIRQDSLSVPTAIDNVNSYDAADTTRRNDSDLIQTDEDVPHLPAAPAPADDGVLLVKPSSAMSSVVAAQDDDHDGSIVKTSPGTTNSSIVVEGVFEQEKDDDTTAASFDSADIVAVDDAIRSHHVAQQRRRRRRRDKKQNRRIIKDSEPSLTTIEEQS